MKVELETGDMGPKVYLFDKKSWVEKNLLCELVQLEGFSDKIDHQELVDLPCRGVNLDRDEAVDANNVVAKGKTITMMMKTFCLSESWSMNVSITAKAEGENLFRSSILIMMTIFLTRMTIMIIIQVPGSRWCRVPGAWWQPGVSWHTIRFFWLLRIEKV